MTYIKRDEAENIIASFRYQLPDQSATYIAEDDAELLEFLNGATWLDVTALQCGLLGTSSAVTQRIMRYQTQMALDTPAPKENAAKYQELLQYCEDVRAQNDIAINPTPQEAIDALKALAIPAEV